MADKGGSGSRKSEGKHPNKNQGRDLKETSNGCQHKAAQTDTLHVRHVGVQLDPSSSGDEDTTDRKMSVQSPSSRDVEQTIRKTSDRSVQSQEESSSGEDNQLVTGSNLNVVGSHGPVQLGTGSTVVNPTYKNCTINHHHHHNNQHHHHHHHYHPPPDHPAYNDYLRWVEQNAAAVGPGPSYPELTSQPRRHSPETQSSEGCRGNSQIPFKRSQTRPVPDDVIRDTVRIIDSKGRVLEPGDAVYAGGSFADIFAVYIGGQQIVTCVGSRPNLMVKEETLNLTSPFRKLTVSRGRCPEFPPGQRVERAKGKIGSLFTEGDSEDGWDFPEWVFTGLGGSKALDKGFRLR